MSKNELMNIRGGYSFGVQLISFVVKTLVKYVRWF